MKLSINILREIILKRIFYLTYFLFLLINSQLYSQNIKLDIFPHQKIYQKYYADAISHQLSISKHLESRQWFGNIGANVPISDISLYHQTIQISIAATVFNTLIKTPGHIQVYTVDYLVDFFFDKQVTNNLVARFIWGHLSAHYSDDGITQLNNFPLSYVRDYIGLHSEFFLNKINGKAYAGGFYNFHNEPVINKHFTFQFGFDSGVKLSKSISTYAALDLKIKSEVNYGTTQSYQIGIKYSSDNNRALRLAYTHRRGFEERGQLFNKKAVKNTLRCIY